VPPRVRVISIPPLGTGNNVGVRALRRLLVMIPGISSGDIPANTRFLDAIRVRAGHDLALFYDWQPGTIGRKTVAPSATEPAGERLAELCERFLDNGTGRTIDLFAHSAGTVVVNKAATHIRATGSRARFRHVLFVGTALDAAEPLAALKAVSASIVNCHSAFDKVNRNINDKEGVLPALRGARWHNVRMDHTLGGRIVRHYVFLSDDPENRIQYAHFLRWGKWPERGGLPPADRCTAERLHCYALTTVHTKERLRRPYAQRETRRLFARRIAPLLAHDDPEIAYYAVLLSGRFKVPGVTETLRGMLRDTRHPVYLRREIYQALGNMEDPEQVQFLREARDADPACDEVIRDVVRELKRKRIRRPAPTRTAPLGTGR